MEYVIIINYYGGIPGCLVEKALVQLEHLKSLQPATSNTRAYLDNTDRVESFRNTFYSSMDRGEKQTMMQRLQRAGYHTCVFGAFGIEPELNHHPPRRNFYPTEMSLKKYGVDDYSIVDGEFFYGSAYAHDSATLYAADDFITNYKDEKPVAIWINLMACADTKRRRTQKMTTSTSSLGIDESIWNHNTPKATDSRLFPDNLHGMLVSSHSLWNELLGEVRTSECGRYGEIYENANKETRQRQFHALLQSAWADMNAIDPLITRVLRTAKNRAGKFSASVLATHVFGLGEHETRDHAPNEACTRSFWCSTNFANIADGVDDVDVPVSIQAFVYRTIHLYCGQQLRNSLLPLTLKTAVQSSNIINEQLWLRFIWQLRGKTYATTYAWTVRDMFPPATSDATIRESLQKYEEQRVPVELLLCSVFDIACDPDEKQNIMDEIKESDLMNVLTRESINAVRSIPKFIIRGIDSKPIGDTASAKKILKLDMVPKVSSFERTVQLKSDKLQPPPVLKKGLSKAASINLRRREAEMNQRHR